MTDERQGLDQRAGAGAAAVGGDRLGGGAMNERTVRILWWLWGTVWGLFWASGALAILIVLWRWVLR